MGYPPAFPLGVTQQGEWSGLPPAEPFYFGPKAGGVNILQGTGVLAGLCLRNTVGTAIARFVLYDGQDVNGTPVFITRLAASGSQQPSPPAVPIAIKTGLFATDDQNGMEGVVWFVQL